MDAEALVLGAEEEVPLPKEELLPEDELLPKALLPKALLPKEELLPEEDDEDELLPKGFVKLLEEPANCDALNPAEEEEEDDAEEELPNGSVKLLEPKAPVPKPEEDEDELPVKEELPKLPKSASATDDMEVMPIISAQAAAVVMMSPLNFTKKSLQMVIRPLYHPKG
ncbi:MAG: hypothetical protein IJC67_00565 [Clostridia bacterium]|nr:hypothetical protein [Clostridia bacterium]